MSRNSFIGVLSTIALAFACRVGAPDAVGRLLRQVQNEGTKGNATLRKKKNENAIDWDKPPWVYVKGQGDKGTGNGNASGSSSGIEDDASMREGSSAAGGALSGRGSNGKTSFGYDPNANKTTEVGKIPPPDGGGKDTPQQPPPNEPPRNIQIFDLWWPMCVFLDPSISQDQGNAAIKGMVDMAAKCGVMVMTFPFTIKANYPNSAGTINQKAQQACNLDGLQVPRGSVSTMVSYSDTAGEMCGLPPEQRTSVGGCAMLGGGENPTLKQQMQGQGGHGFGGFAQSGMAAASIEVPQGWNAKTLAHEAQGHSQLSWPNGTEAGNGIGMPNSGGQGAAGGGWSGIGCGQMRATALPNDRRYPYDANRKYYYAKADTVQKQFDLMEGRKIFKTPTPPPKTPPPTGQPRDVGDNGSPPGDAVNPQNSGETPKGKGKVAYQGQDSPSGKRHKRKPRTDGGGGTELTFSPGPRDGSTPDSRVISAMNIPESGPVSSSSSGDRTSYTYDSNATKTTESGPIEPKDAMNIQAIMGGPGGGPGSTGGGSKSSYSYDANASKSTGSGSSEGGKGASVLEDGYLTGEKKDAGSAAGTSGGANTVDIFGDVKAASGVLEDDFFRNIGKTADEERKERLRRKLPKEQRLERDERRQSKESRGAGIYQ